MQPKAKPDQHDEQIRRLEAREKERDLRANDQTGTGNKPGEI